MSTKDAVDFFVYRGRGAYTSRRCEAFVSDVNGWNEIDAIGLLAGNECRGE
jgi:hypothetical protein